MKIKQLKRQQPRAWEARKRTAYARRSLRAIAKLTAKAMAEAGPEWARVDMVDEELPGKPYFCTVYAKKGEEPKAVPSGEQITFTYSLQIETK